MIRTTTKQVTFKRPFRLSAGGELFPAGCYNVDTDEEILDGLSRLAYRRISTAIYVPGRPDHPGVTRMLMIDPKQLDAALASEEAEREGIERTENEGMVLHA